jgi:hypothetical protein
MQKPTTALIFASIAIAIPAAAGIRHSQIAPSRTSAPRAALTPAAIAAPASASPANAPPPPVALPPLPLALPQLPESPSNVAPPSLDLDRSAPWENETRRATDPASTRPVHRTPIPKTIESVDQWTGAPIEHVVAKKMEIDRSDPWGVRQSPENATSP